MGDDRTSEFLSIVKAVTISDASLEKQTNAHDKNQWNDDPSKKSNFEELRTFHTQAADISKDIASTSALLTQLTEKVKHKSLLFQDQDSVVVNQLVVRIKQSIENLNSRIDLAEKTIQHQKRSLGKKSQIAESSTNLVLGLQNEFAQAASQFKDVLQQRTDSLKENDDFLRKQVYGGKDDMDDIPDMSTHLQTPPPVFSHYSNGGLSQHGNVSGGLFPTLDLTSNLVSDAANSSNLLPRPPGTTTPASISGGSSYRQSMPTPGALGGYSGYNNHYQQYTMNTAALTPLDIQRMEEESGSSQLMQLLPTEQTDYLQTRADAMSTVESYIVELGTTYSKLTGLINEHRELVQRVEDNVEEANTNVLLSMNVLTDTLTNLRSNKMLALKLFSILVTFIVLFIIFFA